MPVILALGKLRQEDYCQFEANLVEVFRLYFNR